MLLHSNLSSVLSTSINLLLSIICRCILYVTVSIPGNTHHAKAARSATLKNRKIICPTKLFYCSISYFEKGDHIDLTIHLKHILDESQFIQRCFHFMGSIPSINISPRYRLHTMLGDSNRWRGSNTCHQFLQYFLIISILVSKSARPVFLCRPAFGDKPE